ncbi:MarR family transcriptional regulator [Paratractidigestivibacter sp.]|uniref:MarR family winged helix-turn-helix transcriptional regulator n=1 Tax=Paratractidigestivibacter sp. TaxID=2847316 RepID=UPI002ABD6EC3|nr:MarR family transcriptional regulator [Paratractidigestivibacter sp.]
MNYEDAANKLIKYSKALAKGSMSGTYGLSMGESPVLAYLCRSEEPLGPSTIAKNLGYTRSRMTRILDALETKGHIRREADKNDGRKVLVYVTPEGRKYSSESRAEGVGTLAESLSTLGEEDTRALIRVLEKAYSITYDREGIVEPTPKKK